MHNLKKKKGVNIEEKLSLARQAIQARKHETPSISIPSISKEKFVVYTFSGATYIKVFKIYL